MSAPVLESNETDFLRSKQVVVVFENLLEDFLVKARHRQAKNVFNFSRCKKKPTLRGCKFGIYWWHSWNAILNSNCRFDIVFQSRFSDACSPRRPSIPSATRWRPTNHWMMDRISFMLSTARSLYGPVVMYRTRTTCRLHCFAPLTMKSQSKLLIKNTHQTDEHLNRTKRTTVR